MNISVKTLQPFRVAGLEHRGPFHTISETWMKFGPAVAEAQLFTPGARIVSVYVVPAQATPESELTSYAAIEIPAGTNPPAPWVVREVPGGDYASTIHTGPYTGLGASWDEFIGGAENATGRPLIPNPSLDVYLNDPGSTPAEDLQTELLVRVGPPQ